MFKIVHDVKSMRNSFSQLCFINYVGYRKNTYISLKIYIALKQPQRDQKYQKYTEVPSSGFSLGFSKLGSQHPLLIEIRMPVDRVRG